MGSQFPLIGLAAARDRLRRTIRRETDALLETRAWWPLLEAATAAQIRRRLITLATGMVMGTVDEAHYQAEMAQINTAIQEALSG